MFYHCNDCFYILLHYSKLHITCVVFYLEMICCYKWFDFSFQKGILCSYQYMYGFGMACHIYPIYQSSVLFNLISKQASYLQKNIKVQTGEFLYYWVTLLISAIKSTFQTLNLFWNDAVIGVTVLKFTCVSRGKIETRP